MNDLNRYSRYQKGLAFQELYPAIAGACACGCGSELRRDRRKWATNECRDNAYINFAVLKGDNSVIRQAVYARDHGVCQQCGLIGEWEADHILPVFMGGGACGLENLQTLCKDCHKEKSVHSLSHHRFISSQAASTAAIRLL